MSEDLIHVPSLCETGSKLKGSSLFFKDELRSLKKKIASRRFLPSFMRQDQEQLIFLLEQIVDVLGEVGDDIYLNERWLYQNANMPRYRAIPRSPFDK